VRVDAPTPTGVFSTSQQPSGGSRVVRKGVPVYQAHPMLGGELLQPIKNLNCKLWPHKLPYLVVAEQGGCA
jgi:hypothetical protein